MSPGPSSGPGLSGPPAAPRVDAESDCASALVSAQRLSAALNALHWGPELRVGGATFGHAPVSEGLESTLLTGGDEIFPFLVGRHTMQHFSFISKSSAKRL